MGEKSGRFFRGRLSLFLSWILCLSGCFLPLAEKRGVDILLFPSSTYQTMTGFGVSGAWWGNELGNWPEAEKQYLADLLFSIESGIGLSMFRYNFGAGGDAAITDPWRGPPCLEKEPLNFDLNRDVGSLWFVKTAQEAGVKHIVGFVNSPPARFTKNGMVSGGEGGASNLDPADYHDFAVYLVDLTGYLVEHGYLINWLSPVNEPDVKWSRRHGQEGCSYTPEQAAALLAAIYSELKDSGLDVKLTPFELCGWKRISSYLEKIREYPELAAGIDTFSVHSYRSSTAERIAGGIFFRENLPSACVWMSEWTEMTSGRDDGMDSALTMANTIHRDLTLARVSSWQKWIAVSKYDYYDGLIYVEPASRRLTVTKRLWVLGNFSRFIRPGAVRIQAKSSDRLLLVSAFRSAGEIIVVCINNGDYHVRVCLTIDQHHSLRLKAVYDTSCDHDLQARMETPETFDLPLLPLSVTTLVLE